jgi:superfamily I DNA/RNA helicase
MSERPIVLTPAQEGLVHLPTEGQFLVRGAAGSGKSVVALERALHLARQPLLHGSPRVLLLARTPALAAPLAKAIGTRDPELAKRVEVSAPSSWSQGMLACDGAAPATLDDEEFAALVDEALTQARRTSRRQILKRPLRFFTSELATMILGLGVETFEQYGAIEREGRGTSLDEDARRTIWSVFESWRSLARALGRDHPHALVPPALARLAGARTHPYDHVVVDDAHRLAPVELKLVRTLAAAGSLTLFAALEQRFDPIAATLHELGLERLDRTEVLPRVMRGPAPIHAAALAVLQRKRAGDGDLAAILPGSIEGARPRLILANGPEEELAAARSEIVRMKSDGRRLREIGVVAARRMTLELLAALLARAGIATRRLGDEPEAEGASNGAADAVALVPLASAAGREFPVTILLDANRGSFPRSPWELADHERSGADDAGRRDLHLAMTRASEELLVSATEATRSPALPVKKMSVEKFSKENEKTAATA